MKRLDSSSPGGRLRIARLQAGLSQADLAVAIGLSPGDAPVISRLESGHRKGTRIQRAAISRVLGVNVWEAPPLESHR